MSPRTETPPDPDPEPPKPDPDAAAWEGSLTATEPQVGPDGHVHLSQEEIDARDS